MRRPATHVTTHRPARPPSTQATTSDLCDHHRPMRRPSTHVTTQLPMRRLIDLHDPRDDSSTYATTIDPCDDPATHVTTQLPMRRLIDPCDDSSTHTTTIDSCDDSSTHTTIAMPVQSILRNHAKIHTVETNTFVKLSGFLVSYCLGGVDGVTDGSAASETDGREVCSINEDDAIESPGQWYPVLRGQEAS
ncbi:hypothetical protein MVEG_00654 [Podila verticillata NRRL 6337]|nr:hypothetical protein MVEG_00654 [Podila verticillata NRRL 6337]